MSDPIDQIVERLTDVIERSKRDASRAGYFAALYRQVTCAVRDKIGTGFFDDDRRMERLDVTFASRYLDAYDQHRNGAAPTRSWAFAFEVDGQWWPIVLQHLLLGMNAHINLDLGLATAATVGSSDELPPLRGDFNRINTLLAALVGKVQNELAEVWPTLRLLLRYLGTVDDELINFSMQAARDQAWRVAERFAALPEPQWPAAIARLDGKVVQIGRRVRYPGITIGSVLRAVRLGERGSVPEIIERLS